MNPLRQVYPKKMFLPLSKEGEIKITSNLLVQGLKLIGSWDGWVNEVPMTRILNNLVNREELYNCFKIELLLLLLKPIKNTNLSSNLINSFLQTKSIQPLPMNSTLSTISLSLQPTIMKNMNKVAPKRNEQSLQKTLLHITKTIKKISHANRSNGLLLLWTSNFPINELKVTLCVLSEIISTFLEVSLSLLRFLPKLIL